MPNQSIETSSELTIDGWLSLPEKILIDRGETIESTGIYIPSVQYSQKLARVMRIRIKFMNTKKSEANKKIPRNAAGVKKWLLGEGFPFEMGVANAFRQAGFGVQQGTYYLDPVTQKTREIDVVAGTTIRGEDTKATIRIDVVVECKVTLDKPWTMLSAPEPTATSISRWNTLSDKGGKILLSNLFEIKNLSENGFVKGPRETGYSLIATFKEKEANDTAYNACVSVGEAVQQLEIRSPSLVTFFDKPTATLKFPMIAVKGPLFNSYLNGKGELVVDEINYGRLIWKQKGPRQDLLIDVVSESYLVEYISILRADLERIHKECTTRNELLEQESVGLGKAFKPTSLPPGEDSSVK